MKEIDCKNLAEVIVNALVASIEQASSKWSSPVKAKERILISVRGELRRRGITI